MNEQKYIVLGKELVQYHKSWDKKTFRATYGVLTMELVEHCSDGDPWHYWSASILVGGFELIKTKSVQYVPGDANSFPRDTMPQTPGEPLRWLRDNATEIAREMRELANWEPG
jgi:hypothetical protein